MPDESRRIEELTALLAAERERREQAEKRERCFCELAEHIREVFWMTNATGDELVYISPAYEHIWGQSCQTLYDNPGRRLAWVHEDDREAALIAFKRDAANGEYDQTIRIVRPDGEQRWIRDRAFPVRDDDGALYRLAGFAVDMTTHVQSTDRLARLGQSISDNGCGVGDCDSLFNAFHTGKPHGLGLGLAVSRTLAQSHGGELWLADRGRTAGSEDHRRTSFVLRLPRR